MKRVGFLVVLPTVSTVIQQTTGALVSDPDGYNIEAVCRKQKRTKEIAS
ncbi:MAG: hypothetical protein QOF64_750 [Candidatus Binatota bacterium]|nr:hypothetical protein [Candidatus Binatota bacterium]